MKKLLLLAPLLRPAHGLPTPRGIPDEMREHLSRAPEEGPSLLGRARDASGDDAGTDVETRYHAQRLDHFAAAADADDGGAASAPTFRQRYFYTARYVGAADDGGGAAGRRPAVAFLCVGGEGPSLGPAVLVDSVHCTGDMLGAAARLHADHGYDVHLFALEHRYYGESFPAGEEEGGRPDYGDYAHLSSRQAVRDIAAFVRSPAARRHLGAAADEADGAAPAPLWITFGGSYPGMLSAWSRLLHPDAVHAAVANSAPVEARLDFGGYHAKEGADLADVAVGGSAACARLVTEGHAEVVAALEETGAGDEDGEDGVDRVAGLFAVCGGADMLRAARRNREMFVGDGVIDVPAQSNDPSCDGHLCNIDKLCAAIVGERDADPDVSAMEILARISQRQSAGCAFVDWDASVRWLSRPAESNANTRSWEYQTCAEFGFYQTCNEESDCPYGRGYHAVDRDLDKCQAVFGIDPADVRANVAATLAYYGGWDLTPAAPAPRPGGTRAALRLGGRGAQTEGGTVAEGRKRILFVSGDVDPWGMLAFPEGRDADHPSVVVPGASHHFWTHAPQDSDGAAVRAARDTIYETLLGWLGVEAPEHRAVPRAKVVAADLRDVLLHSSWK